MEKLDLGRLEGATSSHERSIAIIPARGGSKTLPRKNVRVLAGKPLLAHTIEQARSAELVSRVIVSTDDPEIAGVARQFGAEVIDRPAELSTDDAASELAVLHVLDHLEQVERYEPNLIVLLQCTSPCRSTEDIDGAIRTLREREADSLLSVVPFHRFLWREANGETRSMNYDYTRRPRRQEIEPTYAENGSIYVFKPWVLRDRHNRLGGKVALYVMDYWTQGEIDTADDFALCDWILSSRRR